MFGLSIWHVLILLIVVALIFGRGRISGLMGGFGEGISKFRREPKPADQPPAPVQLTGPEATTSGQSDAKDSME